MGRSSMCPGGHDGPFFMGQDSWAWVFKAKLHDDYDGHMIIEWVYMKYMIEDINHVISLEEHQVNWDMKRDTMEE